MINLNEFKQKALNHTLKTEKTSFTDIEVLKMYNVDFDINTFQKTARRYFKTALLGSTLTLKNSKNNKAITIDFKADPLGYIKIRPLGTTDFLNFQTLQPKYNRDLFIKIFNNKLL